MSRIPLEIERKFLIVYPDTTALSRYPEFREDEITQTYLLEPHARVRRRGREGAWQYTKTVKRSVTDITREEIERTITRQEYERALAQADPARSAIRKTRLSFAYAGHCVEIDLYPEWKKIAVLEVELEREDEEILLPPEVRVLREVTCDPQYSNRALALTFPPEPETL